MFFDFSKVRIVLLDMDNVLLQVTDDKGNYLWRQKIESDLGVKNSDMTSFFTSPAWKAVARGEIAFKEELQKFLDGRGCRAKAETIIEYFYRTNSIAHEEMFITARQLAAGFDVYIATNQDSGRIEYLWNRYFKSMGLKGYFSSSKIRVLKPHPDFWNHIKKKLGMPAESMLMVDDKAKNIDAAITAGLQGYHWQGYEKAANDLFTPLLDLQKPPALHSL